ncbi:MAG: hypothetical protein WAT66_10075 [Actinomycetota bacterium]
MGPPTGIYFLFGAFIVVLGFIVYLGWQRAKKRREEFFRLSVRLGLEYSIKDPFDTPSLPFDLFSRGQQRTAENVLSGEVAGMRVRLFDYSYVIRHHNANGPDTTSTYRFSCALAELDAMCSHLVIDHESFMSRLASHVGIHDIEFESEEFNRAFKIASDDRRFAFAFIDATMMSWLMDEGGVARYEVNGPLALCYVDRVGPAEYENLLEVLHRFRAQMPTVVSSLYPRTREAAT